MLIKNILILVAELIILHVHDWVAASELFRLEGFLEDLVHFSRAWHRRFYVDVFAEAHRFPTSIAVFVLFAKFVLELLDLCGEHRILFFFNNVYRI